MMHILILKRAIDFGSQAKFFHQIRGKLEIDYNLIRSAASSIIRSEINNLM